MSDTRYLVTVDNATGYPEGVQWCETREEAEEVAAKIDTGAVEEHEEEETDREF